MRDDLNILREECIRKGYIFQTDLCKMIPCCTVRAAEHFQKIVDIVADEGKILDGRKIPYKRALEYLNLQESFIHKMAKQERRNIARKKGQCVKFDGQHTEPQ